MDLQDDCAVVVRCLARRPFGGREVELLCQVRRKDGEWHTAGAWICPTGSPTANQLRELAASLAEEASELMVARYGIQGVLM